MTLLDSSVDWRSCTKFRMWHPHGYQSGTVIEANKCGTAATPTITIQCNFEGTPDDIRRFIRSIERAIKWVESEPQCPSHSKVGGEAHGNEPKV